MANFIPSARPDLTPNQESVGKVLIATLVALEVASVVIFTRGAILTVARGPVGRWLWTKGAGTFIRHNFVIGKLPGEAAMIEGIADPFVGLVPGVAGLATLLWWVGLGEPVFTTMTSPFIGVPAGSNLLGGSKDFIAPGGPDDMIEIASKGGFDRVLTLNLAKVDP